MSTSIVVLCFLPSLLLIILHCGPPPTEPKAQGTTQAANSQAVVTNKLARLPQEAVPSTFEHLILESKAAARVDTLHRCMWTHHEVYTIL
jgi:hypothetical protein